MPFEHGHVSDPRRRQFLAQVGGLQRPWLGVASLGTGAAAYEWGGHDDESRALRRRVCEAFEVRLRAALFQKENGADSHPTNGDERRYPNRIGSFSKTLPHDGNGEVDAQAFDALVHAMSTADPTDFEAIPLGGIQKLANPQSGFAFGFGGCTRTQRAFRRRHGSRAQKRPRKWRGSWTWAALTRDVPFDTYASDPGIAAAAADLSALANFRGPKIGGAVTPATIFRGPTSGDVVGPFISQLLWKPFNYGPYAIDQKVRVAAPNLEFLTDYGEWLTVQNGGPAPRPQQYVGTERRDIITARDLTEWLHRDFSHQGGTNAVFILMASGVGFAPGNPYLTSATQSSNQTLGPAQILDLVASIANLSLQACWYHKWSVHRRIRPEEFGGSLRNKLVLGLQRPVHQQLLNSAALAAVHSRFGSALLPMAYPKDAPSSGLSGRTCDLRWCVGNYAEGVLQHERGDDVNRGAQRRRVGAAARTRPHHSPRATRLTSWHRMWRSVECIGGVHWRSDSVQGMLLGESCAIAVLRTSSHMEHPLSASACSRSSMGRL